MGQKRGASSEQKVTKGRVQGGWIVERRTVGKKKKAEGDVAHFAGSPKVRDDAAAVGCRASISRGVCAVLRDID